jgi:DNA-binding transcriptional LysR family regulator
MFRKRSQTNGASTPDLRDISLRALQVFSAVENCGSLTEAARRLGDTRSAVSQHITNLERMVGAPLFDRSARPVTLTPVGQTLSHHARRILQAVDDARIDLMAPPLDSLIELRLGIIDDLDASLAPDLVNLLREHYPRCQVTMTSGRSDDLYTALTEHRVDLILTGYVPDPDPGHSQIAVLREPFMIVAPDGTFGTAADLLSQLPTQPFVRYNATMPLGRMIAQHLRRLRVELAAPFSFDASRSVVAMMARSGGWTITTPLCLLDSGPDARGMVCLPLPFAGLSRTIRLVSRRGELGRLPDDLAAIVRLLLRSRIEPEVARLATWLVGEFEVLDSRAAVTPGASAPAAGGS